MRTRDRLALRRSIARGVRFTLTGYLYEPGSTEDVWCSDTGREWRGQEVRDEIDAVYDMIDAALAQWEDSGEESGA